MTLPVNYDGDALALVQNAYQNSDENMDARLNQYQRDIDLYNAATNISNRDQSMPHIQLPKMFTIVETKSPRDIKALFGRRPVLSWMSKRDEFKATAQIQVEYVDDLLSKAHLYVHGSRGSGKSKLVELAACLLGDLAGEFHEGDLFVGLDDPAILRHDGTVNEF